MSSAEGVGDIASTKNNSLTAFSSYAVTSIFILSAARFNASSSFRLSTTAPASVLCTSLELIIFKATGYPTSIAASLSCWTDALLPSGILKLFFFNHLLPSYSGNTLWSLRCIAGSKYSGSSDKMWERISIQLAAP